MRHRLFIVPLICLFLLVGQTWAIDYEDEEYDEETEQSSKVSYKRFAEYVTEFDEESFNSKVLCVAEYDSNCSSHVIQFYHPDTLEGGELYVYVLSAYFGSNWAPYVRFGAVNCAKNEQLCSDYEADKWTTTKYFGRSEYAQYKTLGEITTVKRFLGKVIDEMLAEYKKHSWSDWPNFTPINNKTVKFDDIFTSPSQNEIMLVFAVNETELGGFDSFVRAYKAAAIDGLPVHRILKSHPLMSDVPADNFPPAFVYHRNIHHINCDADSMKRESVYKNTMNRLNIDFLPAEHAEKVYDRFGNSYFECRNDTRPYIRARRSVVGNAEVSSVLEPLRFELHEPKELPHPTKL